jgi:hypothetical protein
VKDKGADVSAPLLHWEIGRISKAIADSARSNSVLAQPQNMPSTIAVRKAKETTAASTLSLILSSILASFAGMSRLSGAGCAAPMPRVYVGFRWPPRKIDCCSALILPFNL